MLVPRISLVIQSMYIYVPCHLCRDTPFALVTLHFSSSRVLTGTKLALICVKSVLTVHNALCRFRICTHDTDMYLQGPYEEKKWLCRILVLILYFPCWYDAEAAGDVYLQYMVCTARESQSCKAEARKQTPFFYPKTETGFLQFKEPGFKFWEGLHHAIGRKIQF